MTSLTKYSNVGVPGRFIFRIDEWIQPAGCLGVDLDGKSTKTNSRFAIGF